MPENDVCIHPDDYLILRSTTEVVIQRYVFPIQFFLGFIGNAVNLIVLLSRGMRSEVTNILLSVMAFADLGFLCAMLPGSLASFPFAYQSSCFRWYFYKTKLYFHTMANLFSAVSTWYAVFASQVSQLNYSTKLQLILVVSIERFAGIRSPMGARHCWNLSSAIAVIIIIFFLSLLVTSWRIFAYDVLIHEVCNGTQIIGQTGMAQYSWLDRTNCISIYLNYGQLIQLVSIVIIPIFAVAVLNVPLICFMRNRNAINNTRKKRGASTNRRPRSNSDFCIMQRQERKVTATVLAIVTCFTLTHAPSLIPVLMLTCGVKISDTNYSMTAHIANSIVVTGKVLNFLLFCTSSAHFRRKLLAICETIFYKVGINASQILLKILLHEMK
ncbi:unnamed protein product [Enterobius vermicularis]|uniref:G_PROTEIN_RECEP_F1_2 domain-containing protein n=1 Tax=Enterobius vermicularis TaxID=51028 RepID=A0A0N4V8M9_ENTVE|nr:unnamed protein product [Enterobius vermicularis]